MNANKPGILFWIFSVLALLWNMMGVKAYLDQAFKNESYRANFTTEQLAIMDATPSWATAAFAIAVFAGLIGCIALLFRKKLAAILFIISLVAVIIQFSHTLSVSPIADQNSFELSMTVMIPLVLILLIMYAKNLTKKGILA